MRLLLAGLLATVSQAAVLSSLIVSKVAVPTNMCQAGAAATEFLTTDARVTAFAAFQQVAAGDVIVIQWAGLATSYTPAPVVATPSGPGNFCFATSLPIAGGELAKYPGEWIVLVFVNGQFAGSQPFTIKTGAAPTGPTINAGGVVNGADCRCSTRASRPDSRGSTRSTSTRPTFSQTA